MEGRGKMNDLDNYDKKIISILQEDGSISNKDLAEKIGLAPSSCLLRVKNLKEQKIIKKILPVIDEKQLGYKVTAFARIDMSPMNHETTAYFIQEVQSIPQIVECYTITGDGCFLVKIIAKDLEDYRNFVLDKLTSIPSVCSVETSMVVGVEKQTFSVPLE